MGRPQGSVSGASIKTQDCVTTLRLRPSPPPLPSPSNPHFCCPFPVPCPSSLLPLSLSLSSFPTPHPCPPSLRPTPQLPPFLPLLIFVVPFRSYFLFPSSPSLFLPLVPSTPHLPALLLNYPPPTPHFCCPFPVLFPFFSSPSLCFSLYSSLSLSPLPPPYFSITPLLIFVVPSRSHFLLLPSPFTLSPSGPPLLPPPYSPIPPSSHSSFSLSLPGPVSFFSPSPSLFPSIPLERNRKKGGEREREREREREGGGDLSLSLHLSFYFVRLIVSDNNGAVKQRKWVLSDGKGSHIPSDYTQAQKLSSLFATVQLCSSFNKLLHLNRASTGGNACSLVYLRSACNQFHTFFTPHRGHVKNVAGVCKHYGFASLTYQ